MKKNKSKKIDPINASLKRSADLIEAATDLLCQLQEGCQYAHPATYQVLKGEVLTDLITLVDTLRDLSKIKARF